MKRTTKENTLKNLILSTALVLALFAVGCGAPNKPTTTVAPNLAGVWTVDTTDSNNNATEFRVTLVQSTEGDCASVGAWGNCYISTSATEVDGNFYYNSITVLISVSAASTVNGNVHVVTGTMIESQGTGLVQFGLNGQFNPQPNMMGTWSCQTSPVCQSTTGTFTATELP